MAIFNKSNNSLIDSNQSLYETVMIADTSGNPVNLGSNPGQVSTVNSNTTPLSANTSFTGEWEDVSGFDSLVVAAKTDQNGEFYIQFSPDGVNVDSSLTRYYRVGIIEAPHRFTITRRYFRVVFTNSSASAQTFFRLQSLFGSKGYLNAPLDSTLAQDFDSVAVRPSDPKDELILGLRQGSSGSLKFGFNANVSSGSSEVIAAFGGTFTPLTTASTLTIVSDNGGDDLVGTGAQSVIISGIGPTRLYQEEEIDLDGTSSVVTSNTWLGVNRVSVSSSGINQSNIGNILITATTGGSNQAYIPAGTSVTQQLIFHVQDGHQGLIKRTTVNVLKLSGGTSPRVTISVKVFRPDGNTIYTVRRFKIDTSVSNDISRVYDLPIRLIAKDVIWMDIETDQNLTSVDAELDIIEVRVKDL